MCQSQEKIYQYDEEGNGTLSLSIFKMVFGDDIEVDLEGEMSEKDIEDLQSLLSEMNNYVRKILRDYKIYQKLYS